VNKDSGLINVDLLEAFISKKTKLIIVNHYLGNVVDMGKVNRIANLHNIKVINDCIEAFGSKQNRKYLGDKIFNSNFIFNFSTIRNPNTVTGAAVSFWNENEYEKVC
jgi:perosamine synthetase